MSQSRNIFKVKVPQIMFFSDNQEDQVATFQQIIDDVIQETTEQLEIKFIKYNRRNYMRRDRVTN